MGFNPEASQTEDVATQMQDMGSRQSTSVSHVESQMPNPKQGIELSQKYRIGKQQKCDFCGLTGAHVKGKDCPAYGKKCRKCHKINHVSLCADLGAFVNRRARDQNRAEEELKEELEKQLKVLNPQVRAMNFSVMQQSI